MAGDAFLKLSEITGECKDSKHTKWIDITSFSLTISNAEDALKKSDEKSEGPTIEAISIGKKLDRASPKLASLACSGNTMSSATIDLCHSDDGQETYMQYNLKSVSIENYSVSGGDGLATETISLRFNQIEWIFKDGNITGDWDIPENKGS